MKLGSIKRPLVILFAMMLTFTPLLGAAQSDEQAVPAEAIAAVPVAAQDAPSNGDEAPAFPANLTDVDISLEELELRLLPLTTAELSALAAEWQQLAQGEMNIVVEKQVELLGAEGAEADRLRQEIVALSETRNEVFARLSAVVGALADKGGDEAEVAGYRAYRSAIIVEEQQNADFQTLAMQAYRWLISPEGGVQLGIRVLVVLASFYGLVLVARLVRAWVRRALRRVPELSKLMQGFLALLVYWITIAVGLMIVLSALGVDITPIFALVGGASFIIAFAMQDTLGNLAAGLMIMVNRPFDEGDYVTVAGVGGTVQNVSVVATTVTTPDNQVIVIPNSKVWGDVITNVTASETRRVDLVFGIGYDDSIEEAQAVLEEVVKAHPAVLADPAPVIRVNALGPSSVDFIVRPWVKAENYFAVYWDLTRQVKEAFDARGITIPYPQTEMTIRSAPGASPPQLAP